MWRAGPPETCKAISGKLPGLALLLTSVVGVNRQRPGPCLERPLTIAFIPAQPNPIC